MCVRIHVEATSQPLVSFFRHHSVFPCDSFRHKPWALRLAWTGGQQDPGDLLVSDSQWVLGLLEDATTLGFFIFNVDSKK